MNIAIVGSRTFPDEQRVRDFINSIAGPDITIVSGGAKGVDSWAEDQAKKRNFKTITHKPRWDLFGKQAGFIRNEHIIRDADIVVAFWDGKSKGTLHSINLAKSQKKELIIETAESTT